MQFIGRGSSFLSNLLGRCCPGCVVGSVDNVDSCSVWERKAIGTEQAVIIGLTVEQQEYRMFFVGNYLELPQQFDSTWSGKPYLPV